MVPCHYGNSEKNCLYVYLGRSAWYFALHYKQALRVVLEPDDIWARHMRVCYRLPSFEKGPCKIGKYVTPKLQILIILDD